MSFWRMINERAAHKPVQYILNTCEFMGLEFYVDERVLIPRPDTEILAEAVISHTRHSAGLVNRLDIGTGSGALAVSAAVYSPESVVTAVDICPDALEVAVVNAEKHGVTDRVKFLCGDLFEPLKTGQEAGQKFDIIMSNPPYIRENELLPPSVARYEPRKALFGGKDGLDFYRRIIRDAKKYMNPGAMIFLEIGYDQRELVCQMLEDCGFTYINTLRDLSGKDRVIQGGFNVCKT